MSVPDKIRLYHIVHHDKLAAIIEAGHLLSDAEVRRQALPGTGIGDMTIKERRLTNTLQSHPGLAVGDCVPFYFCPRSIMLYVIHMNNRGRAYQGGQAPIATLVFDLHAVRKDADAAGRRWAFTTSNAGAYAFKDYASTDDLGELEWDLIPQRDWRAADVKTAKQSEFLVERCVPWQRVIGIGVQNEATYASVLHALDGAEHRPEVKLLPKWYY